ncbi:MAG: hypothetical protein GY910_07940 [bacterium]|nr:hypothetical protein [Deltaproteobacteria bacterium]MCP4904897.1 hypothetical protein [bacterium]
MSSSRSALASVASTLIAIAACATSPSRIPAVPGCEPEGPARPICLFQSPEDLVALPGGEAILVSEYGAMDGTRAGRLALFTLGSEERRVLFSGGEADGAEAIWGDPACPGPPPPAFSPHGIHLSERPDGALQLLAVQHGGRESIEFFEVVGGGSEFSVLWRGCAVAPERTWINSVAAIPSGGFLATNMMERLSAEDDLAAAFSSGVASGYVVTWTREEGFGRLPGSEGAMPNGIEVSADGRLVFLNSAGDGEVRRIVRATGEVEATAQVLGLDNARWAPDGRLVVASVPADEDVDFGLCAAIEKGFCPIAFEIVAIDPVTMETEVLYRNEGPPMGGGTVGLVIGDELFVGSFAGDRILRIALD